MDSDQDEDGEFVRVATGYTNRDRIDSEDVSKRGEMNRPISTFVNN